MGMKENTKVARNLCGRKRGAAETDLFTSDTFWGISCQEGGSALSPPPRAPVQHLTLKWASLMIHNHIQVPGQGF